MKNKIEKIELTIILDLNNLIAKIFDNLNDHHFSLNNEQYYYFYCCSLRKSEKEKKKTFNKINPNELFNDRLIEQSRINLNQIESNQTAMRHRTENKKKFCLKAIRESMMS